MQENNVRIIQLLESLVQDLDLRQCHHCIQIEQFLLQMHCHILLSTLWPVLIQLFPPIYTVVEVRYH